MANPDGSIVRLEGIHKWFGDHHVLRGLDFALREIDLTKLESRPVRGRAFEYLFYADIAVPRQDLQCTRALVHLAEFAKSMRTLGSYSSWKEKN